MGGNDVRLYHARRVDAVELPSNDYDRDFDIRGVLTKILSRADVDPS
jgi:hypothetical protein